MSSSTGLEEASSGDTKTPSPSFELFDREGDVEERDVEESKASTTRTTRRPATRSQSRQTVKPHVALSAGIVYLEIVILWMHVCCSSLCF